MTHDMENDLEQLGMNESHEDRVAEEEEIAAEIARSNQERSCEEKIAIALENHGVDMSCGACAEIAYTGGNWGHDHTCGKSDGNVDPFAAVRAGHALLSDMQSIFGAGTEITHNPPCPRAASCTVCEDADPSIHFQAVSVTDTGAQVEILDTCRTMKAAIEACRIFLARYPDERAIVQVIYDPSTVWESWEG